MLNVAWGFKSPLESNPWPLVELSNHGILSIICNWHARTMLQGLTNDHNTGVFPFCRPVLFLFHLRDISHKVFWDLKLGVISCLGESFNSLAPEACSGRLKNSKILYGIRIYKSDLEDRLVSLEAVSTWLLSYSYLAISWEFLSWPVSWVCLEQQRYLECSPQHYRVDIMSNDTSNSTSPVSADLPTWNEQLFCGIAQATLGFAGILANLLTVSVLFRSKKLNSSCFILIGGHAGFCFVMSIGWLTNGVEYLGYVLNLMSLTYSRMTCYLMYLTLFMSVPPSSVISFLIALDRTLSVIYPKAYEKREKRFAIASLTLAFGIGLLHAVAAGVTLPEPTSTKIQCFNFFSALHLNFVTYYTNFNFCFALLSVACYALLYGAIAYRKRQVHANQAWSEGSEASFALQRQISLLPIINLLMVAYCIFGVIPPMVSVMLSKIDNGRYLQRGGQYTIVMKVLVTCIDFCVLILKSNEFRATLKRWRAARQSTVGSKSGPTAGW